MAIYKHVSSKEIIRKVFRDLKPATANWIHDSIEWIGEALEHIGASSQLCQKQCVIDINNYTGKLPSDLYYINQVAINTCVSPTTTNQMEIISKQVAELDADIREYYTKVNQSVTLSANGTYNSTLTPSDLEEFDSYHQSNLYRLRELNSQIAVLQSAYFGDGNCLSPLQYGTSTFHASLHCENCVNETASSKDTYIVNCGSIKTSFISGQICLSYMAFPVDEECFPLVPDDISFRDAMFWYICMKLAMGGVKVANPLIGSYEFCEQRWLKYCTQARNAANYPDIDRYQNFMNQWVRLAPNLNNDMSFFETLNDRERFTPDNV